MLALDDHPVGSLPDDAEVVILVHGATSLVHGAASLVHGVASLVHGNGTASAQLVHVHSLMGCCASLDHWLSAAANII